MQQLTSLSTLWVRDDLLQANAKGKSACKEFVFQRCSSIATSDFFDPLKKLKLKSFKELKTVTKVRAKDVVLPIRLDREVFRRMALLGQFRKIDMRLVFTHPLGPLAWAPLPEVTFPVVAGRVFTALKSSPSKRIDVVFDVYKDISIKNVERSKRATGPDGVTNQNILPGFQVKNWSKTEQVVRFLDGQWKEKQFWAKLCNRTFRVTEEEKCWKIDFTDKVDLEALPPC